MRGLGRLQLLRAVPADRRWQSTVQLAYTVNAPDGPAVRPPMVILHGLFGSKQNWRAIAKQLSRTLGCSTYTVDLRNHGDSPHQRPHTYATMASDIVRFIGDHQLARPILLGHSMGGKVAMRTALEQPSLVSQLIVDDMVPVPFGLAHDFAAYVAKLQEIEQAQCESQKRADQMLGEVEPDVGVRQFLLTNMKKLSGVYRSRIPLQLLGDSLQSVMDWDCDGEYTGPTLFIGGKRSPYVKPRAYPAMKQMFPNYQLRELDTGHWVHAEMPREFMQLVQDFVVQNT
ncbi:hypothetical protein IWW55_001430 [Coemansia sp. RSA 2706]|nr:hypothetical protein IWW55_001430 [Coemansia sp. RSA 2706]KAJ2314833.1 hypothetical protein IWW54_000679 [Coemansia sp. RSA 2705]KAJ2366164.1 hypothetical protein H4S01_002856 [Coemansia sp. RSA 2610]KAJ2739460.1 hypothetical protein H4R23_000447 [Coemansia sp. Cherry 401B]